MRAIGLLLLCIVGSTLVSLTVAKDGTTGPDSCCFQYYGRKVPFDKVRNYYITDDRCPKAAVILQTIRDVRICVDPEADWVERMMVELDKRNL